MTASAPWWSAVPLSALVLAGCIPQSDPPLRYEAGDATAGNWPYDHGRRRPPPPSAAERAAEAGERPSASEDEVGRANRRSLDEQDAAADRPRATAGRDRDLGRANDATRDPEPDPRRSGRAEPKPVAAPPADPDAPAPPRARPAWEARTIAADAAEVANGSYTIHARETLRQAGDATGVGAEALARANDIAEPFAVRAGQRLRVPGGRYHLVRPGQSGIAIARAYGVEWSRIVDANGLAEPYTLHVGQRVLIPGGGRPNASAAERAAAFSLDVDDILTGGEPALAVNQAPARPIATATRVLPPTAAIAPPARLTGGFAWPADGRLVRRFGRGESGYRNDGIEIAVPVDTPVRASADGVVAYAGEGIAALGGIVIVRHGDSWTTVYGHASKLLVQRGQSVRRGQTIALSGDTGFADRPELHFELRRGRTPVDPMGQLPRLGG